MLLREHPAAVLAGATPPAFIPARAPDCSPGWVFPDADKFEYVPILRFMETTAVGAAEAGRGSPAGNELQAFAAMLGRGKWIIIGVTLLAAVNAFLLSVTKPKTFDASELLRVQSTASQTSSPNDIITANKSIASTYVTLFTNRGFLAQAAKGIGGRWTLDYLDSHVSASVEGDTVLIRLRATGRTPAEAT